jgi:hypothetical protein
MPRRPFSWWVLYCTKPKGPANKDFKRGRKPRRHVQCKKEGEEGGGVHLRKGKEAGSAVSRSDRQRLHKSACSTLIVLSGCAFLSLSA